MEYVLMDIKNFLKKLENGQLEIEAGQWQLHKALSSMSKAVCDLKNLKEDVEDLRYNNLQQMGLIKELQMQLDRLNEIREEERPVTVSESSVEYERVYKRPTEVQINPKGFKKRKCRIRSEEIIEITSQVSNDKSEVDRSQSDPMVENATTDCSPNTNNRDSDEESTEKVFKKESYILPQQNQTKCHYTSHTVNNDMLQRYLKDSVKYIDKKVSNSTELNQNCTNQNENEKSHSVEYTPFWDEYSSRAPPETHCDNRNSKVSKETSTVTDTPAENIVPRRIVFPKCPKRIAYKEETALRHEKKHRTDDIITYCKTCGKGFRSKELLKDHEASHKTSRTFKGFKCSYCTKICSSPEKLTSHLRQCRLIMKAHYKKRCN